MGGDRCPAAGLSTIWRRFPLGRVARSERAGEPARAHRRPVRLTPLGQRQQQHQRHRFHEGPRSRFDMTHKPLATVLAFAPRTPAGRQRPSPPSGARRGRPRRGRCDLGGPPGPGSDQDRASVRGPGPGGHQGNPRCRPLDGPPSRGGVKTGSPVCWRPRAHANAVRRDQARSGGSRTVRFVFNGRGRRRIVVGASGLPSGGTSSSHLTLPCPPSTIRIQSGDTNYQQRRRYAFDNCPTNKRGFAAASPITGVVNNVTGTVVASQDTRNTQHLNARDSPQERCAFRRASDDS